MKSDLHTPACKESPHFCICAVTRMTPEEALALRHFDVTPSLKVSTLTVDPSKAAIAPKIKISKLTADQLADSGSLVSPGTLVIPDELWADFDPKGVKVSGAPEFISASEYKARQNGGLVAKGGWPTAITAYDDGGNAEKLFKHPGKLETITDAEFEKRARATVTGNMDLVEDLVEQVKWNRGWKWTWFASAAFGWTSFIVYAIRMGWQ